jgi:HlyD family secretion protein
MASRKGAWRIVAIVAATLVLAGAGYLLFGRQKKTKYKTATVARGEILSQVSATGTVNPVSRVTVGSQVSGIVDTVLVDYNDFVKAGQVLARIDPRNYQAALLQSSANLNSARVSLNQAERNHVNAESLARHSLISEDQRLQAETDFELARTRLEQAQANYEQAHTNLAYTTITAPMSGMVVARKVQDGQTVAASFSAPELFNIADLARMQVEVAIQEADVGKLDTGMTATFKVDAYSDKSFEGRLVQIRNEPITNSNVVTYVGIVRVDNPDYLLKPGMTADVKIEVTRVQNVLVIPSSAMNPKLGSLLGLAAARPGSGADSTRKGRAEGGSPAGRSASGEGRMRRRDSSDAPAGRYRPGAEPNAGLARNSPRPRTVYVLEKGVPMPRPVEVGANDSYNSEVRTGLSEGEVVVLGRDQARVNPFTQSSGRPPMGGGFR